MKNEKLRHRRSLFLIAIFFVFGCLQSKAEIVKGTVVDDTGEPLIGATVRLLNAERIAAATDIDGNFSLNVPDLKSAVLAFSYIGMKPLEVKVNGREVVNVTLQPTETSLEEVIVVGYGQQKKASVVGAIAQTTGDVLERAAGVHDISSALTGNLPGVVTMASSGMPGDESASIVIRSASSWNNSAPLVLVDGVERDMASVDVGSVKTISILKDASATAVYGVKGANGVILITTRRGEEGRAKLSANFTATVKSASKLPQKLDSYDALAARNRIIVHELGLMPSSWEHMTPLSEMEKYRNQTSIAQMERYPNIDWEDVLFDDYAMSYNGNVSVSGGTKFVKYFAIIDYVSEGDLFKQIDNGRGYKTGFGYTCLNSRSNLDFQLTPTTVFKVNISGSNARRRSRVPEDGAFDQNTWGNNRVWAGVYSTSPNAFYPIYSDGSFGYYPQNTTHVENSVWNIARGGSNTNTETRINTDFVLEQKLDFITRGLSFRGMISWDNRFMEQGRGISDSTEEIRKWIDPVTGAIQTTTTTEGNSNFDKTPGNNWDTMSGAVKDDMTMKNLYYQLQLNYNRTFGKNTVGLTGVWNRQQLSTGSMVPIGREDWVFRATYDFDNRYFAEYNGAYNGSEKFGKGYRFGFFNSAAVGWRPSAEKFWEPISRWWNELKIRGSYGEIGDDTGDRFLYMEQWGYGGSALMTVNGASSIYQFYRLNALGNPNANWEKVKKMNLGIDFAFLNSKIAGTVEMFKDSRNDILLKGSERAMPSYFGMTPPTTNLGKAESKGFEIELRLNHNFTPDFRVWANLNMTHAFNKIIFKDDPELKPSYQKSAGYSIGQTTSYIDHGTLTSFDDLYGSPAHDIKDETRLPGDLYIIDFNGDGIVDEKDRAPYGFSGTPQNTYNATLGFEWKGLSAFVQFYGVTNVTREVYLRDFINQIDLVFTGRSWIDPASGIGDIRTPRYYSSSTPYSDGTRYLYDGSYVRLKNVEIAYDFHQRWVKKLGLANLRIFLNGNNLWLWTRMPDDRESNFAGGSSDGAYPTMRRYNIGLKFNF